MLNASSGISDSFPPYSSQHYSVVVDTSPCDEGSVLYQLFPNFFQTTLWSDTRELCLHPKAKHWVLTPKSDKKQLPSLAVFESCDCAALGELGACVVRGHTRIFPPTRSLNIDKGRASLCQ